MIGFYLLSIFAMTLGAALVLDFKGFRRFFTRRPGESEEYARKFQTPAILAGLIFFLLPLAAIIRSLTV
nr:hypothetical protein OG409_00865 [Streptomyces sp. NBC_00974]